MSADPKQVMRILDIRGIDIRLADGQLQARWRHGPMPADMTQFIRHFRALIVAELAEAERLARERKAA